MIFQITRPPKGTTPRGEAPAEPDAPTLREVILRDLADGSGCDEYRAWLRRAVQRLGWAE